MNPFYFLLYRPPRKLVLSVDACFYPTTVFQTPFVSGSSTGATSVSTGSTVKPVTSILTIPYTTTPEKAALQTTLVSSTTIPSSTEAAGVTETTTTSALSTNPLLTTITALPPVTTTMNYCVEERGMNQPLTIASKQVSSNPLPVETQPVSDINPISNAPGLSFTSVTPQINVTFDQTATLTLIYLPVDRPNQPSNVEKFSVVFVYPNGSSSDQFQSEIPIMGVTTSTSSIPLESITTPSVESVFPPSDKSPRVDLPSNFEIPTGTVMMITIDSTNDDLNAYGVSSLQCNIFIV